MAEENIGFFGALWRFFTFYRMRKALGIARAADRQFTGSARGIADAFDLQQDTMVKQYQELRNAIAEVEAVLEDKRQRFEKFNDEEEDLIVKRDGALTRAEQAQGAGDEGAYAQHASAYERFDTRIEEIEALQARLEEEIKETEQTMKKYLLQLSEMQAEVQKMPQQKSEAIADFVTSTKILELNDRLSGIQTSMDRGPLDAVLEANKKLTAKARISEKIAGTDVRLQDQDYARAGRASSSKDKLAQTLAARKVEREGGTVEQKPPESEQQDRPKI